MYTHKHTHRWLVLFRTNQLMKIYFIKHVAYILKSGMNMIITRHAKSLTGLSSWYVRVCACSVRDVLITVSFWVLWRLYKKEVYIGIQLFFLNVVILLHQACLLDFLEKWNRKEGLHVPASRDTCINTQEPGRWKEISSHSRSLSHLSQKVVTLATCHLLVVTTWTTRV